MSFDDLPFELHHLTLTKAIEISPASAQSLRTVCRAWAFLIPPVRRKDYGSVVSEKCYGYEICFRLAAAEGSAKLLELYYDWGHETDNCIRLDAACTAAARNGHYESFVLVAGWIEKLGEQPQYEKSLYLATKAGNMRLMEYCNEKADPPFGQHVYGLSLNFASEGGQLEAMRWAEAHGAITYHTAMIYAARHNHTDAIRLVADWIRESDDQSASWASTLTGALNEASECGQLDAMRCIKQIHSDDPFYPSMYVYRMATLLYATAEAKDLLNEWIAELE